MDSEGLPMRNVIDVVKNSQGEAFVDFLEGVDMAVVNGRKGRDAFMCISGRGCSVVDYCIRSWQGKPDKIERFKVIINHVREC